MEAILLFAIHNSTCTVYEILRNAFKLCEMHEIYLYKTKLRTKCGSFWSEIRNEIWSISNEIQAKAKLPLTTDPRPRLSTDEPQFAARLV